MMLIPQIIMDSGEFSTSRAVKKRLVKLADPKDPKIELEVIDLKVADFIAGKRMIERKGSVDFVNSIMDGRLWRQAKDLCNAAEEFKIIPVILIEGSPNFILKRPSFTQFNPASFIGAWRSLLEDFHYKLEVIWSPNSFWTVLWLLNWAQEKTKREAIHAIRRSARKYWTKDMKARYILEGVEGIGGVTSDKLLKKHGSLAEVFLHAMSIACPKELRKIHELLSYEYGTEEEEKGCDTISGKEH